MEERFVQITDIRVHKIETEGKLRAIASVTFDGVFVVHDIKVIEGSNGMFIAMPSRKNSRGEQKDIAHPIVTDLRVELSEKILSAYNELQ